MTLAVTASLATPASAVGSHGRHFKPSPSPSSLPSASPSPSLSPSPSPSVSSTNATIQRNSAGQLTLNGSAYRFTGVNAYELGTLWAVNTGCGAQVDNLDGLFSSLRTNSVVRFWAFQSLGINKYTHTVDWTALDRVFASAAKYHQRLLPVLSDQSGTCDDGHWHDPAWYNGGYKTLFNDNGSGKNIMSFDSWVNKVVPRYASSPALGMWELVNEPEAPTCQSGYTGNDCFGHSTCAESMATASMRSFFDVEGSRIHALDALHLLAAGLLGSGQCGSAGGDYKSVGASTGLDVMTVHDYGSDSVVLPGDQWNGISVRISQAKALAKPIFTEEVGILAATSMSCVSYLNRRDLLRNKAVSQLQAGMSGFVPWDWTPAAKSTCDADIGPSDPTLAMLASISLQTAFM
ncbi:MAG: hypothetical protein ABJA34_11280 [Pseudonocardiales bacterium]